MRIVVIGVRFNVQYILFNNVISKLYQENTIKDIQNILLCFKIQTKIKNTIKIYTNSLITIPKTLALEYQEKKDEISKDKNDIINKTQPTNQNFDNFLYFWPLKELVFNSLFSIFLSKNS
jgi:hypothetical protein